MEKKRSAASINRPGHDVKRPGGSSSAGGVGTSSARATVELDSHDDQVSRMSLSCPQVNSPPEGSRHRDRVAAVYERDRVWGRGMGRGRQERKYSMP